jgi:hypothetical protein
MKNVSTTVAAMPARPQTKNVPDSKKAAENRETVIHNAIESVAWRNWLHVFTVIRRQFALFHAPRLRRVLRFSGKNGRGAARLKPCPYY